MEDEQYEPYEYEVDLRDYISVLWQNKWIILLIVVVAMGVAYGFSKLQPSTYRTRTSFIITPRVSQQIVRKEEGGLSSVSLPTTAYERSALASDLLHQIARDLDLTDKNGKYVSTATLHHMMQVDVDMEERNDSDGESVRFPLITMAVQGNEPEKIQQIANKWAELFQRKITELFAVETAKSFQFISSRFESVEEGLRSLETKKQEYLEEHPLELLQNEVSVLQKEYSSSLSRFQQKESELNSNKNELAAVKAEYDEYNPLAAIEKDELASEYESLYGELQQKESRLREKSSRLSSLREALAEESQFLTLERSISDEALWEYLTGDVGEERLKLLPGLTISDQEKNDVYFSLKHEQRRTQVEVNTLKENIPQVEGRLEELQETLGEDLDKIKVSKWDRKGYVSSLFTRMKDMEMEVGKLTEEVFYLQGKTQELKGKIQSKQAKINEVELKIEQLDRDIDRLKHSYKTLSDNLEEARIAKEEKESSVRVMDTAVVPEKPLSTATKQNVAVAGVLGLFIGVLAAFFKHYMEGYEPNPDSKEEDDK
ncbi:MAG: GumC family protein [Candidatus Acetothermia bacterium]